MKLKKKKNNLPWSSSSHTCNGTNSAKWDRASLGGHQRWVTLTSTGQVLTFKIPTTPLLFTSTYMLSQHVLRTLLTSQIPSLYLGNIHFEFFFEGTLQEAVNFKI